MLIGGCQGLERLPVGNNVADASLDQVGVCVGAGNIASIVCAMEQAVCSILDSGSGQERGRVIPSDGRSLQQLGCMPPYTGTRNTIYEPRFLSWPKQSRAVGNGIHFCDTTKRKNQTLTPHIQGETPLYHRSGEINP